MFLCPLFKCVFYSEYLSSLYYDWSTINKICFLIFQTMFRIVRYFNVSVIQIINFYFRMRMPERKATVIWLQTLVTKTTRQDLPWASTESTGTVPDRGLTAGQIAPHQTCHHRPVPHLLSSIRTGSEGLEKNREPREASRLLRTGSQTEMVNPRHRELRTRLDSPGLEICHRWATRTRMEVHPLECRDSLPGHLW